MTISERLQYFITECYKTTKVFAEVIDEPPNNIYRYANSSSVLASGKLIKFQKAGLSVDWLLTGVGSMFVSNSVGYRLMDEFEPNEESDSKKPFDKIKRWIKQNYGSLKVFSIIINVDYREIYDILYNDSVMSPEYLKLFEKAGCNINWVLFDEDNEYSNTPYGLILSEKKKNMEEAIKGGAIDSGLPICYYGTDSTGIAKELQNSMIEEFVNANKERQS